MTLIVACDAFPPIKSSASEQMASLVKHLSYFEETFVFFPTHHIHDDTLSKMKQQGINLFPVHPLFLRSDILLLRAIGEILLSIKMIFIFILNFKRFRKVKGFIWYSPSIFLVFFALVVKWLTGARSYLVLRDIFPNWAGDLGLIKKDGFSYLILEFIASRQFSVASKIGVQSESCKKILTKCYKVQPNKIELLNNWSGPLETSTRRQSIIKDSMTSRPIVVYAGNLGVAQGVYIMHDILVKNKKKNIFNFVFLGSGTEKASLEHFVATQEIPNVYFFDAVPFNEIRNIYKSCDIGLILLDRKHKTNNKPGKLIGYLQAGLPVFAMVNKENDLIDYINSNNLGIALSSSESSELIWQNLLKLKLRVNQSQIICQNLVDFSRHEFSAEAVAEKILKNIHVIK